MAGSDTRSLALSEKLCTVIAQCAASLTVQLSGQDFRFQSLPFVLVPRIRRLKGAVVRDHGQLAAVSGVSGVLTLGLIDLIILQST